MRHLTVLYVKWAEGYYSSSEMLGVRAMAKWVNSEAGELKFPTTTQRRTMNPKRRSDFPKLLQSFFRRGFGTSGANQAWHTSAT